MKKPWLNFNNVLLGAGGLMLAAFLGYLFVAGLDQYPEEPRWDIADADVDAGRIAIVRHGCAACHVVPGVRQARGRVGPKLEDFRDQLFIAGMLPNSPENLIRWIRFPQDINPGTAMPNLGLTEEEARNIAAYIYQNP